MYTYPFPHKASDQNSDRILIVQKTMTVQQWCTETAQVIKALDFLGDQTAVHRKKFEFALSQFRKFRQLLLTEKNESEPTEFQRNEILNMTKQVKQLRKILMEYLLQTWCQPTIECSSNTALNAIRDVIKKMKESVLKVRPEFAECFDPESSYWDHYNELDLRAIHASFSQYIESPNIDPELAGKIHRRLESIEEKLVKSEKEIAPRVFSPIPVNYQSWRISHDDFEEIREIGGGVSAIVFHGKMKKTGEDVAIKKFKFKKMNGSKLQTFQREVAVLATMNHPALLHLVGATDTLPFCIVTEWMPNHSLYHDLHAYHHLDETLKSICAYDIARGMQYMHSLHLVHRDLKSLNILLDANDHARICDFGFSRHDSAQMSQNIGTPHWMAPEVLQQNTNYTSKVDVYAYGVVLWEIVTESVPYPGMEAGVIIQQVLEKDIRPALPSDISPPMRDLITRCWDRNPDVRPTFDEIVEELRTGDVLVIGADRDEFLKYVAQSETTAEQKLHDATAVFNRLENSSLNSQKALKKLQKTGIPAELLDRALNDCSLFSDDILPSFLELFVGTSKMSEVCLKLRQMPRNSILPDIMNKFISEMPTASAQTDTDIVVAACKNGAADLACLYASHAADIALALEVVASSGADPCLKAAVGDRCVQKLSSADERLKAAAVRCLIALGESKRITQKALLKMLDSNDRKLGCLAICAGASASNDIFSILKSKFYEERCFALAAIASILNEEIASSLLDIIKTPLSDEAASVMIKSWKYENLRPRIKEMVAQGYEHMGSEAATVLNEIIG